MLSTRWGAFSFFKDLLTLSLGKHLQSKLLFQKVYFRKDTETLQKIFKFHWWNRSPKSQRTHTDLEIIWKHALTKMKQPPPDHYLHSGKHLYKLQMFCTQNRLEPDCKHLLFFQCTDPLAPWLHVFATPTAFNPTLKQQWVCKSAIHHLELYLLPSCIRPAKAPKNMTNTWHVETYQH